MKILNGNELYVQKCDVEVALKDKKRMPSDISAKLEKRMTEEPEQSQKRFLLFEDEAIANYFRGLDYVLDYEIMRKLSWTEAVELCESAIIELSKAQENKNGLSEEEYDVKIELLKHKLETIKMVVQSKKGNMVVGTAEKPKAKMKLFNIGKKRK